MRLGHPPHILSSEKSLPYCPIKDWSGEFMALPISLVETEDFQNGAYLDTVGKVMSL